MIVFNCLDVGPVGDVETQAYGKVPFLILDTDATHVTLSPNVVPIERVTVTVAQHVVHLASVLDVRVCSNHIFAIPCGFVLEPARAVHRDVISRSQIKP